MLFQKGHTINKGRIPWNKDKKGVSTGGRKKKGKEVICTGCGIPFYKSLSEIIGNNFHSSDCFRKYLRNNKERSWSKDVYLKNSGENNHNFKDMMATYSSLHKWVTYQKGRPEFCVDCGATKYEVFLEWSNQSGLYLRDLNDFVGRCYFCHKAHDKKLGFPRKNSFDKQGRRIGITIFIPIEYMQTQDKLPPSTSHKAI